MVYIFNKYIRWFCCRRWATFLGERCSGTGKGQRTHTGAHQGIPNEEDLYIVILPGVILEYPPLEMLNKNR